MKSRIVVHIVAALAVSCVLACCSSNKPPESPSVPASPHADKPAAAVASEASQREESAEAPTPIPATAGDIWKAIDKQSADLQAIIQNGALKEVHHKAYAIRDLVAALPAHATGVSSDAQARLQQDVKFVATLAERLDAAGDAGDKADAEANYRKLVAVLGGMTRFP